MTVRAGFLRKHLRGNTSCFDVQFAEIIPHGRTLSTVNVTQVAKVVTCLHDEIGGRLRILCHRKQVISRFFTLYHGDDVHILKR